MKMLAALVSFAKALVLALALLLLCIPIPTTWAAGGLSVTTPNGGQKWTIGKKYAIKWRKGTGGASVRISLTKSGRHYKWISKKTRNDGRYTWKIPASITTGSAYKIKIKSVKKKRVLDSSNGYFSIKSGDVRAISKAKDTITKKRPTCLKSIKLGRTIRSRFTVACPSAKRSGRRAKYYSFRLASTKKVTINLKSSIDTYLNLLQGKGRTGRIIKSDDDGGSGRNSKIVKTLRKGTYTIEATTYAKRRSGPFTLSTSSSGGASGGKVTVRGNWSGSWRSSLGVSGRLTTSFTTAGTTFRGPVRIYGSDCFYNEYATGTQRGRKVTFGIASSAIIFDGTITGSRFSGRYVVYTGWCAGDAGTFSVRRR